MAAGVGGLQTALILIGFIIRFQPNFSNNIEVDDVRPENLGFYACQLDIKESKFDYTIQKLCSGHLKCTKITVSEYTKLGKSNETYFCKICTDRLPKFTDSYFGETSFRSNDNVFNLTGSSLSSTHD